jgi:hypothetical protein
VIGSGKSKCQRKNFSIPENTRLIVTACARDAGKPLAYCKTYTSVYS